MKKYTLLIIPLLLLLTQCRKDNKTTFIKTSGKVLEFGSNKPIKNAKVGIYEEGGEFLGSTWTKLLDTTRTDAAGFYHFDKGTLDKGSSFFIFATARNCFSDDPNNYLITGQQITNLNIILEPYVWFDIHVKNINPFDNNDSIRLGGVIGTLTGLHEGKNVELRYINKIRSGIPLTASWMVSKNRIRHWFTDTLKVQAYDTLKYEILY